MSLASSDWPQQCHLVGLFSLEHVTVPGPPETIDHSPGNELIRLTQLKNIPLLVCRVRIGRFVLIVCELDCAHVTELFEGRAVVLT